MTSLRRGRLVHLALFTVLTSCGTPPTAASGHAVPWRVQLDERLDDASHRFTRDGPNFRAFSREARFGATFSSEGIHVGDPARGVSVRTTHVAADERSHPIVPKLGACIRGLAQPDGTCVQRLEYAAPSITEWWVSQADGFEQGWTVQSPPPIGTDVVVEIAVTDAEVDVRPTDVWLTAVSDEVYQVTALHAWDAAGNTLPAHFEAADEGFRIRVDTAGAHYPIEIDPVYRQQWRVYAQPYVNPQSAQAAGDVNGDGYDDILFTEGTYGYIFLGTASGLSTQSWASLNTDAQGIGDLNGDGYGDLIQFVAPVSEADGDGEGRHLLYDGQTCLYFGAATPIPRESAPCTPGITAAAAVGDVNGDGIDDLLTGRATWFQGSDGQATVSYGSASFPSATDRLEQFGGDFGDFYLGQRVASAGDVNGDGFNDVLVDGAYSPSGQLFLGAATGIRTTAVGAVGYTGPDPWQTAYNATGIGDANGDGYSDVIARITTNRTYEVYYGSAEGLSQAPATSIDEVSAGLTPPFPLGDIDGDGFSDVALIVEVSPDSGVFTVKVYGGGAAGLSENPSFELTKPLAGFGGTVTPAGDINADGFADFLVGSNTEVSTYFGSRAGPIDTAWDSSSFEAQNAAAFGASIAGLGDINADGYDDAAVGVPAPDHLGMVYIFEGSATGLETTASVALLAPADAVEFGATVEGIGDINRDGFADFAVGAPASRGDAGTVYLYRGSATGATAVPSQTLRGSESGGRFGETLSPAGDVNRDGYGDLLVAAPRSNHDAGRVDVYHGSPTGIVTSAAIHLEGDGPAREFGSTAGGGYDLNGDDYSDIFVHSNATADSPAQVAVFLGSSRGITATAANVLVGYDLSTFSFGESLAGAGDVNNDGYDDLLISDTQRLDPKGRAYVYHGSASGVSDPPTTVLSGLHASLRFFGWQLAAAGDVNADGYADILVSEAAVADNAVASDSDSVWLFEGSAVGIVPLGDDTLHRYDHEIKGDRQHPFENLYPANAQPPSRAPHFGDVLAAGGDLNGDGYDDVLVASDRVGGGGAAYAFYGYDAALYDLDHDGVYGDIDCDDSDPNVHPGAAEICDTSHQTDENCNGLVDDLDPEIRGPFSTFRVYPDRDNDGDGDATSVQVTFETCAIPAGFSWYNGDCDDNDSARSSRRPEICDAANVDENCNLAADNDDPTAIDPTYACSDRDADGYQLSDECAFFCDLPAGYATENGHPDCDDSNPAIHPRAEEADCDDPIDYNCDGQSQGADADGDGVPACEDCDDTNATVYPEAVEQCDGLDHNCNGSTDDYEDSLRYRDVDADGYLLAEPAVSSCHEVPGYFLGNGQPFDCDDTDPTVYPGAVEIPDDGIDQDCDGDRPDDTGETDTTESDDPADTGAPAPRDCGCNSRANTGSSALIVGAALLLLLRRRSPRW